MAKKTINAKEILADIKAGLNNSALGLNNTGLMEKYQLSEKGLQSVFRKLVDAGELIQVADLGYPANIHFQEMAQSKR